VRRRVALLVIIGVVLLAAAVWLDRGAAVPTEARPTPIDADEQHVYVVQPGDTLWSIARRLTTDGDVRETVDELADRQGSASIAVGDRIPIAGLVGDP
jgi:hypothetical protein